MASWAGSSGSTPVSQRATFQEAFRVLGKLSQGEAPVPSAANPDQVLLEAHVQLNLLKSRNIYTRYPLGIIAVHPAPDTIGLQVESVERATETLFNILPVCGPDGELHGVPGLRITRWHKTAIELHVLGQPARLCLSGLPHRLWRQAEAGTLSKWIDPAEMRLCWRSSPTKYTTVKREGRSMWEDPDDDYTQTIRRGAWLSSGLLRRVALLHTVSNTFVADGYRALDHVALVVRSSHVRGQGPRPHHIVAALLDPVFGLPLRVARFRGDTDESYGADQHFILRDRAGTAALDLRASTEKTPSRMDGTLWRSIMRRLPTRGFTSPETGPLTILDGIGAP
ncbi:hypothetical protein [Streptomyces yaizuensis]|uniref:Uncharacterized protein n=1 Tax=Streptomyces yaizuensis TaxID=2989713 RepID=A0ABQ5P8E6_9ACTN|nr:hypothetical protein [Streptomyces sp. YSPA8]GLF98848.1 hypothetical protein SYYSPA8_31145 [Streptomyces sp. YSPA8]